MCGGSHPKQTSGAHDRGNEDCLADGLQNGRRTVECGDPCKFWMLLTLYRCVRLVDWCCLLTWLLFITYVHFSSFFKDIRLTLTQHLAEMLHCIIKLMCAAQTVDDCGHWLLPWHVCWETVYRRSGGKPEPYHEQVSSCNRESANILLQSNQLGLTIQHNEIVLQVFVLSFSNMSLFLQDGTQSVFCSKKVRKSWMHWKWP